MTEMIGHTYADGRTKFRVWAPQKKEIVLLIGSPEPQEIAMRREEDGYWTEEAASLPGATYRYRVDGAGPYPDPASRWQPDGVFGPSAVVDPAFGWKDRDWKGIPLADMVIYELHTGAFSDLHTFAGVEGRLDYLANLGVNTIELMPVAQFPGERNWGYDGVFPFAVQNSYGGPDGLRMLVNEAHAKGIAVILDVVYNHLGPEGNSLGEFGPYFTDKYKTFWGETLNFDDAYSDGVKEFFIANALMWLDEYHIDGLRLDAVHALKDLSADHVVAQISRAAHALGERLGVPKLLIAEIDLNDARYIRPRDAGGYGLDGQWLDEFHHALHALLTGETAGYYEDFGKPEQLVKAFRESYVYNGNYSPHRKRRFGSDASAHPYGQFVVFAQNHDQIGNRVLGDRLAKSLSPAALRLAAAATLLSPYVPLLFMGEEYGESNPFYFFVDHRDPGLLAAVNQGRREEFAYFGHDADFPDPTRPETFADSVLSWDYRKPERDKLLRWYRFLLTLRKTHPALASRDRGDLDAATAGDRLIRLERRHGDARLVAWFNFSDRGQTVPDSRNDGLALLADAESEHWPAPAATDAGSIAPWGTLIFHRPF